MRWARVRGETKLERRVSYLWSGNSVSSVGEIFLTHERASWEQPVCRFRQGLCLLLECASLHWLSMVDR